MKCSKCKKDFEAGVKAAYKLGLQDGEERLKKTINKVLRNNTVILTANQRLAQELLRLDDIYPVKDTPVIIIPWKKAKQIPQRLSDSPLRRYLVDLIHEQLQNYPNIVDKLTI